MLAETNGDESGEMPESGRMMGSERSSASVTSPEQTSRGPSQMDDMNGNEHRTV